MRNPVDYLSKKYPMKLSKQDTFSKMEVLEMLEEIQEPLETPKYETIYYLVTGDSSYFERTFKDKATEGFIPAGSLSTCICHYSSVIYSLLMCKVTPIV